MKTQNTQNEKNQDHGVDSKSQDSLGNSPYRRKKSDSITRLVAFGVIFLLIFYVVYQTGFERGLSQAKAQPSGPSIENAVVLNKESGMEYVDFSLFWNVWELLKDRYVDSEDLDAQELVYGAIEGMLYSTGDPYTAFLDPEANQAFTENLEGAFEGIGAEVGMRNMVLTIIAPLDGSPAQKAGLRARDVILKIDDQETANLSLNEAVALMRGQRGTDVKLTVFRNDQIDETIDIVVTRGLIEVEDVTWEMLGNSLAHIKVRQFGDTVAKDFRMVLNEAISAGAQGIVLDLRNNPGGLLDQSIAMASAILPSKSVVVIEEDHDGSRQEFTTSAPSIANEIPLVVLINEGSASASEILAGALRDNRKDVQIVGMQSYGKGSVQELIALPGQTAVKITVAKWLTPSGVQINGEGITPDIEVERTDEDFNADNDPQLDTAINVLLGK